MRFERNRLANPCLVKYDVAVVICWALDKRLVAIAFLVLLLVPVGAQSVFANPGNTVVELLGPAPLQPDQTQFPISDPDGLLEFSSPVETTPLGCVPAIVLQTPNTSLPRTITVVDCEPDGDATTWELTTTGVTCISGSCLPQVIGGEYFTLDTNALLLAGMQTNLAWIILVLAAAGIGAVVLRKKF